jgi:hypothetical protein
MQFRPNTWENKKKNKKTNPDSRPIKDLNLHNAAKRSTLAQANAHSWTKHSAEPRCWQ